METVAFSALRKLPFNQDSCIFLTAGTFKKALSAFIYPTIEQYQSKKAENRGNCSAAKTL